MSDDEKSAGLGRDDRKALLPCQMSTETVHAVKAAVRISGPLPR